MKAFLSYQFKDDIKDIINLLHEFNIEMFDSVTELDTGTSLQKSIKKAISDCDFVILVYTETNSNIAFEAGVSYALNKPIFSIISEYDDIPDFLYDSPYVHARPKEIEKIKFNFSIFIKSVRPKTKISSIKKHKYYGGGLPNFYHEIYQNYLNLDKSIERNYEFFFQDIMNKYSLNVIQNKNDSKSNFYADFCIWSDELSNIIGNPIIIEIKKNIDIKELNNLTALLHSVLERNVAEACIIFYDKLTGIDKKELPNSPKCLFIEISEFIQKLDGRDFNESIKLIRNNIVHNFY